MNLLFNFTLPRERDVNELIEVIFKRPFGQEGLAESPIETDSLKVDLTPRHTHKHLTTQLPRIE